VTNRFLATAVATVGLISISGCAIGAQRPAADVLIDDTSVYPESITSMSDGTLINGSVKGVVYRAVGSATTATAWIRSTPENGMLSVLGVVADERAKLLWLCSAAMPVPGAPSGAGKVSSLMTFDLKTGAPKSVYPFPAPSSACNDIAIAKDGSAYATDTPNGRIFKVAPGSKTLELFLQDDKLKGIDGIAFSGDWTMYANIVTRGALVRIGKDKSITELTLSEPVKGPDGMRLIEGNRFLLAEGQGGRVDEVTVSGDNATIRVLKDGLNSPPGVTLVGKTVYAIEGKITYLFDPKLKGQDPGQFKALAIPLN
jgi:hypothetical protein